MHTFSSPLIALIRFLATTACTIGVLLISGHVCAQESGNQEESPVPILTREQAESLQMESTQGEEIPLLGEKGGVVLDDMQERGSKLVSYFAKWVDSFFDDPRYLVEENRSRIKIKLALGYSELYDFEFQPGVDIRLNLPQLENRFNIFISANDDSDFDVDSNPISNADPNSGEELTVGVRYFLALGERYNVSVDTGLSLSYVFAGLRYRHLHQFLSTDWNGRFTNRLRYYSDDGWENRASYDVERALGERFFLRTTLTGIVAQRFDGVPASAVAKLYQVLNIDRALLYEVGVFTNTEPEFELTDLQLRLRYRQRFYRDWLVVEVAPQVSFPNEFDNETNLGLVVKLEADFGYLKDLKAYESVLKF